MTDRKCSQPVHGSYETPGSLNFAQKAFFFFLNFALPLSTRGAKLRVTETHPALSFDRQANKLRRLAVAVNKHVFSSYGFCPQMDRQNKLFFSAEDVLFEITRSSDDEIEEREDRDEGDIKYA